MRDVKVCEETLLRPNAMPNLVLDVRVSQLNAQDHQFNQGTAAAHL